MFLILRDRFGMPGLISVIALVFAMTGGAFAAKYLITSTNQIKPSVLKKLKGAKGPAGPAGLQGPAGPPGAKGAAGEKGVQGEKGDPWTAGGTLPSTETETGAWSVFIGEEGGVSTAFSFPIPLTAPLGGSSTQINSQEFPTGATEAEKANCPGTLASPDAKPGFFCLYEGFAHSAIPAENISVLGITNPSTVSNDPGVGKSGGAALIIGPAFGIAYGSWAVTAP